MFEKDIYRERRRILKERVGKGIILLPGNDESPMNFRDNAYPFRQDSTFLYFFGINQPDFNGLLDCDEGSEWLFADDYTIDDYIWMGNQPKVSLLALQTGITSSAPAGDLKKRLQSIKAKGGVIHFLPPYREANQLKLYDWLDIEPGQSRSTSSEELTRAVVEMRNYKSPEEISEITRAVDISVDMHVKAMKCCRPGILESEIAAQVEQVALAANGRPSFSTIATINGQTLHNHYHGNLLKKGDLFLLDAGAETAMGYAGDLSSTMPVGGEFSPQQRDIYNLALASHERAIELLSPGRPFIDIYYESARVIVDGLKGMGFMKGSTDNALEAGAHAMFFPCGLGHMMGLDVHDMENLGEELVGYGGKAKSPQFGVKSLRLGRKLEPGFVLTIEPGIYFIPQLMDFWQEKNINGEFLNYEKIGEYRDFGGIRNEENFLITPEGYKRLGKAKPKTVEEVEAITGL